MLQTTKKGSQLPTGRQLDQLALALSEQIAKKTGKSPLYILEEIVQIGETLRDRSQKKSAAKAAKRSSSSPKSGAHTLATSKA